MKKYGLIGRTLGHSFSKNFFTKYFDNQSIDAEYVNFELEQIQDVEHLIQTGIQGLNVTIPYKSEVIPFLDELSNEALQIGAVNTIQFKAGKTIGHNTDAYGFQQSIKPFLTFQHERALILGTGGASKAVAYVLENIGIDVLYLSRAPQGAKQFGYDEANEHMIKACKLIVNTTPVGTFPNVDDFISIPFEALTEEHLVVDLIYNPAKTKFLEKSEAAGATILNGQSMLEQQALKAWEIWNS
jgi:shikimate dehydrogenase